MITVGMNYEVAPSKNEAFERKFALVVDLMQTIGEHVRTALYRDVSAPQSYLVVSEWRSRTGFDAFVQSEAFRKTTAWGQSGILTVRPKHQVYGAEEVHAPSGGCPVHAAPPVAE